MPERQAKHWSDRVSQGGSLVIVKVNGDNADRAQEILRSSADEVRAHEAGEPSESDAHSDFPNYGSDGGSSQWGQRVLRVLDDEVVIGERTVTRDKGSKKFD